MNTSKLLPLFILSSIFVLSACEATSSTEESTYSLQILNEVAVDFDIHISISETVDYENYGSISASSSVILEGFEQGTSYTITVTEVGGQPDNWYFQDIFMNDNTDLITITIEPLF